MDPTRLAPGQHFHTIFQISDVHIHNKGRYHEYQTVFQHLVAQIRQHPKYDPVTSLIINTGDTLDQCGRMSAEAIDLVQQLRKSLTQLAYNFWIPGNHDVKRDNDQQTDLDSLSAILDQPRETQNFVYQTESGVWLVGDNLAVFHWSVVPDSWRDPSFLPKQLLEMDWLPEKEQHRTKIALCHAGIDSATGQNGYLLRGCEYRVSDFDGFDLVLLGDTHQYQLLGPTRTMAYPGSLIQQNHGEHLTQHGGCLVWDLATGTTELLQIPNPYSFRTFTVQEGNLVEPVDPPLTPHLRLRLRPDRHTTPEQLRDLRDQLQQTHGTQIAPGDLQVEPVADSNHGTAPTTSPETTYDSEAQFQAYLKREFPEQADQLVTLDQHYKTQLQLQTSSTLSVEPTVILGYRWTNLFNFQGSHQLRLDQLIPGIKSIYGQNKQGKSKLVEILLVALYGREPRRFPDIITKGERQGETTLTFQQGQFRYQLHRRFQIRGHSPKPSLTRTDAYGITTDLADRKDKRVIEDLIHRLVGPEDILLYTNISKQDGHLGFTLMTPKERTQLLKRLLDTDQYDRIAKKVKTDWNDLTKHQIKPAETEVERLRQHLEQHQLVSQREQQAKERIQQLTQQRQRCQQHYTTACQRDGEIQTWRAEQTRITQEQLQVKQRIQPTPVTEATYQTQRDQLHTDTETAQASLDQLQQQLDRLHQQLHPIQDSEGLQQHWDQLQERQNHLTHTIRQLETQLSELNQQTESLRHQDSDAQSRLQQLQTSHTQLTAATRRTDWTYGKTKHYRQELERLQTVQAQQQHQLQEFPETLTEEYQRGDHQFAQTDGTALQARYQRYQHQLTETEALQSRLTSLTQEKTKLQQQLDANPYRYNEFCTDCAHNQKIDCVARTRERIQQLGVELQQHHATLQQLEHDTQAQAELPQTYDSYLRYQTVKQTYLRYQDLQRDLAQTTRDQESLQNESQDWKQYRRDQTELDQVTTQLHQQQSSYQHILQSLQDTQAQSNEVQTQLTAQQQHLAETKTELVEYQRDQRRFVENQQIEAQLQETRQRHQATQDRLTELHAQTELLTTQYQTWQNNQTHLDSLTQLDQAHTDLQHRLTKLEALPQRDDCEAKLHETEEQLATAREHHLLAKQAVAQATQDQQTLAQLTQQLEQDQQQADLLQTYLTATKQFPTLLVQHSINLLQQEANRILLNLTQEFTLAVEFEESRGVFDFNRVDREGIHTYLEYCSGFERFAIGMALRYALTRIGHASSVNVLIIDEGFGVMDRHHLRHARNWLEPLTQIYQHVLIITHIEELQHNLPHKIKIRAGRLDASGATGTLAS